MKKLKLPKRFPSSLQERCSRHSVRRPETTLGCWQRQHRHQIFICFYMGASKTYSCEQLLGMDGQRAPRETAQPAGCNQKLSASELSSSTCYFLPPSITEGLCFLHSQKLWDVNQLMLDPGLKPHFFFLTTFQISSFLAVRTSPDAKKACPDVWLLLPWQLLDVQQTVNSLFFQAPEWNQNFPWSWGMQTEQRLSRTAACSEPQSFRALKQHRSIANNRDVLPSQTANSRLKLPMTTFAPVKYDTKQSYSFSAIYTLAFTAMKYQLAY